jgi:hypothetical protein
MLDGKEPGPDGWSVTFCAGTTCRPPATTLADLDRELEVLSATMEPDA